MLIIITPNFMSPDRKREKMRDGKMFPSKIG